MNSGWNWQPTKYLVANRQRGRRFGPPSKRLHGGTAGPKPPQLCSGAQGGRRAQAGGRLEPHGGWPALPLGWQDDGFDPAQVRVVGELEDLHALSCGVAPHELEALLLHALNVVDVDLRQG